MFIIFNHFFTPNQLSKIFVLCFVILVFLSLFVKKAKWHFLFFAYFVMCCVVFFCPTDSEKIYSINLTLFRVTRYNIFHLLQNILLFVPLGFFLFGCTKKAARSIVLLTLFSLLVEISQFFIFGRVADVNDFLANSVGAIFGVAAAVATKKFGGTKNELQNKKCLLKGNQL